MPDNPTLPEVIRASLEAYGRKLHTALPGKVKSYDRETQRAEVIPVVQAAVPRADGSVALEDLPVIPSVPVRWPKAGGCYIHFPMAPGDWVLLIFNEAAIGHWRETGKVPSPPGDLTRHGPSYPYALPCAGPDDDVFEDAPAGEAVVVVENLLRVSSAGGSADFVALAAKVDANFAAIIDLFSSWAPVPNDGGAALKTLTGSLSFDAVGATKLKAE